MSFTQGWFVPVMVTYGVLKSRFFKIVTLLNYVTFASCCRKKWPFTIINFNCCPLKFLFAKFGWKCSMQFYYVHLNFIGEKSCIAFFKLVSLEEDKDMKRLQKKGQTDIWTNDVQVFRKVHLSFQLRLAKTQHKYNP